MFGNLYLSRHIGDPDMIGNRTVPRKSMEIPTIQIGISVSWASVTHPCWKCRVYQAHYLQMHKCRSQYPSRHLAVFISHGGHHASAV
jgi:hypothetical protein